MRTKQQSIQDRVPCASILIALTVIILFSCSQKAFAQQWSTSGNDISNTNSGNVGVGTTSPGVKLDILSSVNLIARFGSTAGAHSQVLIDAPAGFNSNLTLQRGGVSKWYMGNRASNDRLSFIESTGLVETLTLLQNGNVGIGTSMPSALLEVNKAQNAGTTLVVDNGHNTAGNEAFSGLFLKQAGTYRFAVTSNNDGNSAQFGGPGAVQIVNFANGPMMFFTNNNERMRILANGSVGIGTTSPGVGGIPSSLYLTLASSSGNRPVFEFVSNTPDGVGYEAGFLDFIFNTNSAGHKRIGMISYETEGATANQRGGVMRLFTKANAGNLFERMRVDSSGNVGIGTSAPSYRLDVQGGQINVSGGLCIAGDCKAAWSQVGGPWSTSGTNIFYNAGNIGIGTTGPNFKLQVTANSTAGQLAVTGSSNTNKQLRLGFNTTSDYGLIEAVIDGTAFKNLALQPNGGNVGISTSAPNYRLDVQGGQINVSGGLCIAGDCKTAWSQVGGPWSTSGTNIFYNAGNVGIGTSTPTTAPGYTALSLNNTTGTLVDFMTSNALKVRLQSDGTTFYLNNLANGPIQIYTNNTERMRIDSSGNIGIGTTTPGAKLEVAGNINVTGTGNITAAGTIEGSNVKAKYQDVAEWVPAAHTLLPGTVVALDPTKSNHVTASSQPYDIRVAGVVSAQPGIALGEQSENKVLVATTGRVRIKVIASDPIQVGDLLVTSDIPGVAMKSQPLNIDGVQIHRPGTIIGKALEPLAKGSGEILVLLSLQ